MPNRVIKESICSSESIDRLSWFEEVLFYRLIVNCDDYGRFDGRPAIIKARLFPLKERITAKDISAALVSLADAGVVTTYVCEGKPLLYLPSWEVHQNIRAKKSKYPSPDDGVITSASNCNQMLSNAPVIQSNPNPNPNPNTNVRDGFDDFWKAYPKKVGKGDAQKAWDKGKPPLDKILSALEWQRGSAQWTKDNGQYIPNPSTYLNQKRWEDEPVAAQDKTGRTGRAPDNDEMEAIRRMMQDG